ncbi:MAG: UDP-2,4-diacetamido-2,4,6-trideoxy-beta-L-altropyranose hydrolase [Candidatus Desulfofervidaceae bacterium]|nr:UDP-2,4-diacetamido-2,4,6-trideoxy-beta-L-altropyranose hydrolase [Candidatus Desulfofervidaceae bacterium]
MKIFIRCDGGRKLGTGHIIRQLMIAKELKRLTQKEIIFLMKDIPEGIQRVEKEGFLVKKLPTNMNLISEAKQILNIFESILPDLLIIDILGTSKDYMKLLKTKTRIVSFDDHTEGKYLADLRFNILELNKETPALNLFEGPKYVTLNPAFYAYHTKEKNIREKANKILVTFGGSDPGNLTNKTLRALQRFDRKLEMDIVIGFAFPYIEELETNLKKSKHKIKLHKNISAQEMAELMFENDIGIGAGGLTQYEFVSIGLPAFIICENVQHQYELANWFENKGALINLGMDEHISEEIIALRITELLNDYLKRQKMSRTAKMLCDGKGLKRTVYKILEVLQ